MRKELDVNSTKFGGQLVLQSCGQLFISHLMAILLKCNYVLRICEIIWLSFGELGHSCYLYDLPNRNLDL